MTEELTPERMGKMIGHMNDDHPSSIVDYCKAFGAAPDTVDARMTALDASGFDVEAMTANGPRLIHFDFDGTLTEPIQVREALIKMATDAAAALEQNTHPSQG